MVTLEPVRPTVRLVAGLDLIGYDELAVICAACEGVAIAALMLVVAAVLGALGW